jgi:cytidine deaminase
MKMDTENLAPIEAEAPARAQAAPKSKRPSKKATRADATPPEPTVEHELKAEKAPKGKNPKAEKKSKAAKEPKAKKPKKADKKPKADKEPKAKKPKAAKAPKVKKPKAPKEPKAKKPKASKEPKAKKPKAPKEPKAKKPKAPKELKTAKAENRAPERAHDSLDALIEEARKAQKNAYAPYSKFRVGAALVTKSGRVFHGCNVENASYPAGICAERTALVSMIAAGEKNPVAIAIVTPGKRGGSPCGVCRQTLTELGKNDLRIALVGSDGKGSSARRDTTLGAIFPDAFDFEPEHDPRL